MHCAVGTSYARFDFSANLRIGQAHFFACLQGGLLLFWTSMSMLSRYHANRSMSAVASSVDQLEQAFLSNQVRQKSFQVNFRVVNAHKLHMVCPRVAVVSYGHAKEVKVRCKEQQQ